MILKRRFLGSLALLSSLVLATSSCGVTTIGVVVAGLGIAGAGLSSYCAINSCPAALSTYAPLIINEAVADVPILESGATTTVKIAEIVANLNKLIAQGQALSGLTTQQQNLVTTILNSLSAFLTALSALPPSSTLSAGATGNVVKIPPMTSQDLAKIAEMKVKIAALK